MPPTLAPSVAGEGERFVRTPGTLVSLVAYANLGPLSGRIFAGAHDGAIHSIDPKTGAVTVLAGIFAVR